MILALPFPVKLDSLRIQLHQLHSFQLADRRKVYLSVMIHYSEPHNFCLRCNPIFTNMTIFLVWLATHVRLYLFTFDTSCTEEYVVENSSKKERVHRIKKEIKNITSWFCIASYIVHLDTCDNDRWFCGFDWHA